MTDGRSRLPRLAGWLLRCLPLGDRRADIETDFEELFEARSRERGPAYAARRLAADGFSVVARGLQPRGGTLAGDLRFAVRLFSRNPVVVGIAIGGLALAIAVSTSVFTVFDALVLGPDTMDDPASVVTILRTHEHGMSTSWPYGEYMQLRAAAQLATVEASLSDGVRLTRTADGDEIKTDGVKFVSGGYMSMLGGRAVLGRSLTPSDDVSGAPPVAVLNSTFWSARLGGDPSLVGKTMWCGGTAVTIVGVIEKTFMGPSDKAPSLWAPFASYGPIFRAPAFDASNGSAVEIVGRLHPGIGLAAAEQQLSLAARSVARAAPVGVFASHEAPSGVRLEEAGSRIEHSVFMYAVLGMILFVVGLVLALACANVANLLLAGASARGREIGLRLALGATRGRILAQLLTESLLIGLGAGALGLVLARWLVLPLLQGVTELPDVSLNLHVCAVATLLALISGVGAGLAPARYGAKGDVLGVLKSEGAQSGSAPAASRLRRWFIGFQAAASILLLVTAALFTRAALHITHIDLGFDADKLVFTTPSFPRLAYDKTRTTLYWQSALEAVEGLPTVENAALVEYPPFGPGIEVQAIGHNGQPYSLYTNRTSDRYFATAGFRLIRGRSYTAAEVLADAPVAVVSESVVRDLLGHLEPIGAQLSSVDPNISGGNATIVGVVADAFTWRSRPGGTGTIYRPLGGAHTGAASLIVRAADPGVLARTVDQTLARMDRDVRTETTPVRVNVDRYFNEPRTLATVSSGVALLALALAVLGIYGVTAFVVNQRRHEVGVRMALGASSADVVRLLVCDNLRPIAIGFAVGLGAALLGVRVFTVVLFDVSPYDPTAIGGAIVILLGSALTAIVVPARRAGRTDPASVLRST